MESKISKEKYTSTPPTLARTFNTHQAGGRRHGGAAPSSPGTPPAQDTTASTTTTASAAASPQTVLEACSRSFLLARLAG